MEHRLTMQQDNDTNHAARASIVRMGQSNPRHNPFENLRQNLIIFVHRWSPSNVTKLELF